MDADASFSASLRLLRAGEYLEGWRLYEARRQLARIDVMKPITEAPEWSGEPLSGKRIVVCAEQGFGDQIMFGRYLPQLVDLGAEVVLSCHPKLARLFERAGYWTRACLQDRPIPDCDVWTVFGSLPRHVGGPLPAPDYLSLGVHRGGEGVGVVGVGSPLHTNDAARSLNGDQLATLLRFGRDLLPEATGLYDFADTADLILGLDLVVTVDTAIAHLAGSLGVPVWVLLATPADWRWGTHERSAWYPSARLFRQPAPGDWSQVLRDAESALGERHDSHQDAPSATSAGCDA